MRRAGAMAAAVLAGTAVGQSGEAYRAGTAVELVRAEVVARVSAAHLAYAGNQDTYVARAWFGKEDGHEQEGKGGRLVLLVDRYPAAGVAIRRSVLQEHRELEMRVRRDDGCDRRAREVTLRATGSEVYREEIRGILDERAEDPVPIACYQVEHAATRVVR